MLFLFPKAQREREREWSSFKASALFSSLQVTKLTNYCTKLLFSSVVSFTMQLKQPGKFYVYLSCSSWYVSPGALKWVLTFWKLQPILILMNKSPTKICEAAYWWNGNGNADPAASFKHWHKLPIQVSCLSYQYSNTDNSGGLINFHLEAFYFFYFWNIAHISVSQKCFKGVYLWKCAPQEMLKTVRSGRP